MKRVAVLMAKGYEEGETLTIVDLLRRANIECHTFYFDNEFVEGMHHMMIKADQKFSDEIKDYDVLVLPGGRPGGENLRNNEDVIQMVQYFVIHVTPSIDFLLFLVSILLFRYLHLQIARLRVY